MANPLTRFITERFITPAVRAQLPAVQKDTTAFAVGVTPQANATLRDTLGQQPDTDYALLYNIYQAHADVSACVALWAGGVTSNGWRIGLLDQEAEPTDKQRKTIDELTTWLKNPNPSKRFSRILYEIVAHMAITGDSYLNKATDRRGRILELWSIHPSTLRIVADEHGAIQGYVQTYRGATVRFKPEEISRLQLPSVVNDLYGHSPLESVLEEVHVDLHALRSNRAIFENGLKPSAAILLETMTEENAKRAKELLRQQHIGSNHHHGLMVLGGVKDVKPYAQTLKDMEFTALRALTTEKVARAFRVPKFLLGQKEGADYATSEANERVFYTGTIKPLQTIISEVITEDIIHSFDPELAFYFNEPDFNNADDLRKDALSAHHQGIIDDDEVRERFFAMPKKTPEQLAAEEEERQRQQEQFEPADKPASEQDEEEPEEAGTKATDAPAKKAVGTALTADALEAIRVRREGIFDRLETAMQPEIVRYFTRQEGKHVESLATAFKRLPRGKHGAVEKGVVDDLVSGYMGDWADYDRELAIILFGKLDDAANAGADEAQLQIGFSMDAEQQMQVVNEYLLNNAFAHAKGINQTTRDQLTTSLTLGIKDGEGIPELTARVKSIFGTATNARARTIARTETAQAFEYANQRAMRESGVVSSRRWLTARDERTEALCFSLEGVTVLLDQPFPGNVEPGFIHPNCRCTSVGVVSAY